MVLTDAPSAAEVIFVIEATAANGAYINELKTNYIVPTLEYFHGGSLEDGSIGNAVYGAVVVRAADCHPAPPTTTLGPYSCPQHLVNAIDQLQCIGGRGEGHACLAEGLSVALLCLEEIGRPDSTRHVLLLCCSPPYAAAAGGVLGFPGSATAELAAKALGERGVNVSILAPRKIPALLRLFEHAGGDLAAAQARNYAKDPRHLVLLRGFSLKERPPSPAPPPVLAPEQTQPMPTQDSLMLAAYRQQVPPRPQPPSSFPQAQQYPRVPGGWRMPNQAPRPSYPSNSVLLTQLAQPSYPPNTQNIPSQQPQQPPSRMPMLGTGPGPNQNPGTPQQPQMPGSVPQMPGAGPSAGTSNPPPGTQQQQAPLQRNYIWSGVLEWMEKGKGPGDQQKVTKHLPCQVSSNSKDVEPDLKADTWPNKLLMQLMPKQLIGNIGGQYLKDSKSVLFHLQQNEALESLTKVMVSGFAGCVHFTPVSPTPQCDIKVLILLYTADKKAYLGFIPNNQTTFVERLRKVIQQQKHSQMNKQVPGPGGPVGPMGPSGGPMGPAGGPGPSQALVPGQMQPHPQAGMMIGGMPPGGGMAGPGAGGGKGVPRPPRHPVDDMEAARLEAARQQNLEKIQQLQQTLEAAQQQEAQYRSQMDIMSHLQAAQQQEQHFKQLDEQRKQQQLQAQLQQLRAGLAPHLAQQRLMRPTMPNNQLRHLLQQQPQYRPGGNQARPPSQPQQFDDVPNYNDFM